MIIKSMITQGQPTDAYPEVVDDLPVHGHADSPRFEHGPRQRHLQGIIKY